MTRIAATMRWDALLQWRYRLYHAGGFVTVLWIVFLGYLPAQSLDRLLPVFVFLNLNVTTFYFMAGLVLFEKGQGSLEAIVVTPLRTGEYLGSKVLTLLLLGLVECSIIIVIVYGLGVRWAEILIGSALLSAMYTLLGFLLVVRYDSINRFLLPSGLAVFLIQLPMFEALGFWRTPLFYLWPTKAALVLLQAGFRPVETWELAYGLVYSGVSVLVLYRLALGAFRRFIVRGEGAH